MSENTRELLARRAAAIASAKAILDGADSAGRDLSADERSQFDALSAQVDGMSADLERRTKVDGWGGMLDGGKIGMSPAETRQYSILRAVSAIAGSMTGNTRALESAGLELEASRAVAQALGKEPRGFYVPLDIQVAEYRDVEKTGTASGAQLVATEKLAGSLIDVLRNKMMVRAAGARILGGLVGDISIPRKTSTSTAYWIGEGLATTESNLVMSQLALTPKTLSGMTDITRKMMKQSSVDVEALTRDDIAQTLQVELDRAALHGTGASNQPTGIAATSGINAVYAGGAATNGTNANGSAPVWADIVNLEAGVAVSNADTGALAYMTNPKVRAKYRLTQIGTNLPMIWGADNSLLGYPAYVTSQVTATGSKGASSNICSAMFFGNWSELIIAMWGGLDLVVDPYTASNKGDVRVAAFMDVDIGVRHPGSFSVCVDMLAG